MKDVAVFILTARCNMRCKFCLSGKERDMSTAYVKAKIRKLPTHVRRVAFTGGEPFVRADLYELLEYAKRRGYETSVSTNATLLDLKDERLDLIDTLLLPLDGLEGAHDRLRGRGHFKLVLRVLNSLRDKRVVINSIATCKNWKELPKLGLLLKGYEQVVGWRIFRFRPIGRGKNYREMFEIDMNTFTKLKCKIKDPRVRFIEDVEEFDKEYYKFIVY
jgi:MoaA/NifB/PqqE/SkfB family radical SAM enzyme